tara:strand:+ start:118 stop:501 length:384 start_codon:yes stop_codon:yes gene_type:complete
MGRFYHGDIEGKFMVAVQSSDDADFFGVVGQPPESHLEYCFTDEDLSKIKKGLKDCSLELGNNRIRNKLDKFFETRDSYNDEMLTKEFGWHPLRVKEYLKWYARIQLGEQILECVEEYGDCNFQAEL